MDHDLLPDRNLIKQGELVAQAPGAELCMGDPHHMHLGAGWRAEQAVAVMLARQYNLHGPKWKHEMFTKKDV